jgi:hypothetical protein
MIEKTYIFNYKKLIDTQIKKILYYLFCQTHSNNELKFIFEKTDLTCNANERLLT